MDISDDRFFQLNEKVFNLNRDTYTKAPWKDVDKSLRIVLEHLAGLTIINLYTNPTEKIDKQKNQNGGPLYTKQLLERAQKCCKEEINQIAADIWNPLIDDIKEHNISSHGTSETNDEKEKKAYQNVKKTIPLLRNFLLTDSQGVAAFPQDLKAKFKETGWHIAQLERFLIRTALSPEEDSMVNSTIKEIIGFDSLPYYNEYYYVLILPKDMSQATVDALTPLSAFKWNFVLDFGNNMGEVFSNWNRISATQLLNVANSTKRLSSNLANWIFMRGITGNEKKSAIRRFIQALSLRTLPRKNIIVFNVDTNAENILEALLSLWNLVSISEESDISSDTTIFTIKNTGEKVIDILLEDEGYEIGGIRTVDVTPSIFLDIIRLALPSTGVSNEDMMPVINRQKYLDAGIKFIDTDDGYVAKAIWDNFYAGHQIKREELDSQYDVSPRGNIKKYIDFVNKIRDSIKDLSTLVFRIRHQPGAGGTTVGRRIAFDLHRESEGRVFPIWITKWNSTTTPEQIKELADKYEYVWRWLIITEDKEIDDSEFDSMLRKLRSYNIPVVCIRISHHLVLDSFKLEEISFLLPSRLSGILERKKFDDRFKKAFGPIIPSKDIEYMLTNLRTYGDNVEMIHYPYSFTERAMEHMPVEVEYIDTYVRNWFSFIDNDRLKALVGLIAFTYRFAKSKALDIYSIESLWRNEAIKGCFLEQVGEQNKTVITHLLKLSNEDGNSVDTTTSYAPRYAVFADQILNSWDSTWRGKLSEISIQLIKLLPLNGYEEESLLRELFITQSKNFRGTKNGKIGQLTDRVSYLVGSILNSEEGLDGAIRVFNELIEKYPNKPIYGVHKARLLFEYAHAGQYGPNDKLFIEAEDLMNNVLKNDINDDTIYHVVGMFWDRKVKAIYREKETSIDTEEGKIEFENTIVDTAEKALEYFELYNTMNQGRSQYGYVSGARLIIWLLNKIVVLRQKSISDLLEEEIIIKYVHLLDRNILALENDLFAEDSEDTEQLMQLRTDYLKLMGNLQETLALIRDKFDTVNSRYKSYYGHQEVSIMLYKGKTGDNFHLKNRFESLDDNEIKRMESVLTILRNSNEDLRAAEKLFLLYRFVRRDSLENSITSSALIAWYSLAKKSEDKISLMKAAYYMSVMYALRLMDSTVEDKTLKDKYLTYKKECEWIGFENDESTGSPHLFLREGFNGRWNCLLEPYEAVISSKGKSRVYSHFCKRVEASINEINRRRGFCQVGLLTNISFGSQKLISSDMGKKKLVNGIMGFSYAGPGLYNFNIALIGDVEDMSNLGSTPLDKREESYIKEGETGTTDSSGLAIQNNLQVQKQQKKDSDQKIQVNPYKTELPKIDIKIVGKIDLDKIKDSRRRK